MLAEGAIERGGNQRDSCVRRFTSIEHSEQPSVSSRCRVSLEWACRSLRSFVPSIAESSGSLMKELHCETKI